MKRILPVLPYLIPILALPLAVTALPAVQEERNFQVTLAADDIPLVAGPAVKLVEIRTTLLANPRTTTTPAARQQGIQQAPAEIPENDAVTYYFQKPDPPAAAVIVRGIADMVATENQTYDLAPQTQRPARITLTN